MFELDASLGSRLHSVSPTHSQNRPAAEPGDARKQPPKYAVFENACSFLAHASSVRVAVRRRSAVVFISSNTSRTCGCLERLRGHLELLRTLEIEFTLRSTSFCVSVDDPQQASRDHFDFRLSVTRSSPITCSTFTASLLTLAISTSSQLCGSFSNFITFFLSVSLSACVTLLLRCFLLQV